MCGLGGGDDGGGERFLVVLGQSPPPHRWWWQPGYGDCLQAAKPGWWHSDLYASNTFFACHDLLYAGWKMEDQSPGMEDGRRRGRQRVRWLRWHHQLNGHEFEQVPGESEGQGSLTCCSPWVAKSRHY